MTYTQDCSRYGRVWHTAFYNKWDGQMTVVGTDKTHNITGGDYNQWKENQVDLFSFLGRVFFFVVEVFSELLRTFDW